jgi:RNA polymerase sigma-70 factor (ECF subfamily)
MDPGLTTCWTVIRAAGEGAAAERDEFARRYGGVLRSWFRARWRGGAFGQDVDDAVQEVFVECLREGGVLARADPDHAGGFRAVLYGVARNVALRCEDRSRGRGGAGRGARDPAAASVELDQLPLDEPTLSRAFDRAWAQGLLHEAVARLAARATADGERALRRVELLRRRFGDGVAIRDLAREWGVDAADLHHEYARARREFAGSLHDVVAFHHPGATAGEITRECEELARLVAT